MGFPFLFKISVFLSIQLRQENTPADIEFTFHFERADMVMEKLIN